MKKRSPKLESTQKTEQDRPFRKFLLLVKGQRKKSHPKGQSQWSAKSEQHTVWVSSGFSGWSTDRVVEKLTSSYDVALT